MQLTTESNDTQWRIEEDQQHQSCPDRASNLESRISIPVAIPFTCKYKFPNRSNWCWHICGLKPGDPGLLIFLPCAALFWDETLRNNGEKEMYKRLLLWPEQSSLSLAISLSFPKFLGFWITQARKRPFTKYFIFLVASPNGPQGNGSPTLPALRLHVWASTEAQAGL